MATFYQKGEKKMENLKIYKSGLLPVQNLRIMETGNRFGIMTTKKTYYPEEFDKEDREKAFLQARMEASKHYNKDFDPYKFYMPTQDGKGKAVTLTKEMIEASWDGWNLDIQADILLVTDKTPGVVVGYPVADCPVIIASDLKQGVTATAHCGAEMIDQYLPKLTVESLQSKYDSKLDDISIYVGAHAGTNWTYDRWPVWANDSFWAKAITKKDGMYKINLKKAILRQLNPRKFDSFYMNDDNTLTNPNYYSNSAFKNGAEEKKGLNFTGAYYKKK